MIYILVDDVRDLSGMDIICRTGEAGYEVLGHYLPTKVHLYIDHDLGIGMTGYQLIRKLLEMEKCPHRIQIVSSNPVGVANIGAALTNAGYSKALNGRDYDLRTETR